MNEEITEEDIEYSTISPNHTIPSLFWDNEADKEYDKQILTSSLNTAAIDTHFHQHFDDYQPSNLLFAAIGSKHTDYYSNLTQNIIQSFDISLTKVFCYDLSSIESDFQLTHHFQHLTQNYPNDIKLIILHNIDSISPKYIRQLDILFRLTDSTTTQMRSFVILMTFSIDSTPVQTHFNPQEMLSSPLTQWKQTLGDYFNAPEYYFNGPAFIGRINKFVLQENLVSTFTTLPSNLMTSKPLCLTINKERKAFKHQQSQLELMLQQHETIAIDFTTFLSLFSIVVILFYLIKWMFRRLFIVSLSKRIVPNKNETVSGDQRRNQQEDSDELDEENEDNNLDNKDNVVRQPSQYSTPNVLREKRLLSSNRKSTAVANLYCPIGITSSLTKSHLSPPPQTQHASKGEKRSKSPISPSVENSIAIKDDLLASETSIIQESQEVKETEEETTNNIANQIIEESPFVSRPKIARSPPFRTPLLSFESQPPVESVESVVSSTPIIPPNISEKLSIAKDEIPILVPQAIASVDPLPTKKVTHRKPKQENTTLPPRQTRSMTRHHP